MATTIQRQDLLKRLVRGERLTLVEALPPEYYNEGHIPGALNMPHEKVDYLAPKLLPDRDATIVVYCASGSCENSEIAADRLRELGYETVFDYPEGKDDWEQAGLPLESADMAA